MIVATAGHVDHGKTSLVRALTGRDTTSGAEAQQRGMTIDLGFAQAPANGAASGTEAGTDTLTAALDVIDVPGHARFLRNTLAGLACIDVALLVIAADDGPMPQTREHLAILGLLAVPHCLVALSKVDRVSPQRLAAAQAEVAALLDSGPYAGAPVLPVATPSGAGLPALRQHLQRLQQALLAQARIEQTEQADPAHHFRLAVDRSFLQAGAGRIVTGAVLSGCVQVGSALLLAPHGIPVRVRGLQVQHQAASSAVAGQRCALNLAGAALHNSPPVRGDWLVAPAAHAPTDRLDVWLHNLPASARAHRVALQLHLGAAVRNARLALLDGVALAPGASGLAQLVLDRPVAACYGDRFILRDVAAGPVAVGPGAAGSTLAGGWVIDPFGPARGRSRPDRLARLAAQQPADAATALAGLLALSPLGLDLQRFVQARNLAGAAAAALHTSTSLQRVITTPGGGAWAVSSAHWQALDAQLGGALAAHHAAQPEHAGPSQAELASTLGLRSAPALLHALLAARLAAGTLLRQGLRHHLPGHQPVLPADAEALLARIRALLQPAGLRPPIVGDLAVQLGLPLASLLDLLQRAHQLGRLVRVAPNRYFLPETVGQLARHAQDLAAEAQAAAEAAADASATAPEITPAGATASETTHPAAPTPAGFDAAAYRDRTGIGRNLTVQVLEFLDHAGLTGFDGRQRHWRQ